MRKDYVLYLKEAADTEKVISILESHDIVYEIKYNSICWFAAIEIKYGSCKKRILKKILKGFKNKRARIYYSLSSESETE